MSAHVVHLVPSTSLGRIEDVMPEAVGESVNDWIELGRKLLDKKRTAARQGKWQPTHPVDESAAHLSPASAAACPAIAELASVALLLKWPVTAVLKQLGPKAWEINQHPKPTGAPMYGYSPLTSFAEAGEAEAIRVETGWTIVTPPGWSVLFKNVPNNLHGSPRGITFAEGIVRTDQATIPLAAHAFLDARVKEIKIKRGEPMAVVMPFRREEVDFAIDESPEARAEAERLAALDRTAFGTGAGVYRRLYMEAHDPSPLYPWLQERTRGVGAPDGGPATPRNDAGRLAASKKDEPES